MNNNIICYNFIKCLESHVIGNIFDTFKVKLRIKIGNIVDNMVCSSKVRLVSVSTSVYSRI